MRTKTRQPLLGSILVAFLVGTGLAGLISLDWQRLVARLAADSKSLAVSAPSATLPPGMARPITRSRIRVIDGDTIDLDGRRVRLVGFNAPETWQPACSAEAAAGAHATMRLRELVATQSLSYRRIACSCAPGTEGTAACNHGRACGSLFAGGRDVGAILVAERLALPYVCGHTSCPPVSRPWCG